MLSPKEPHNSPLFESDTINAQASSGSPAPSAPHGRSRWLKLLIALTLAGLIIGVSAVGGLFWYYGRELPDFERLEGYAPPQMTRVYAHGDGEREGEELAAFYRARRTMVPQAQISPVMVKALLAAEDADFYEHQGLDYWGMLRALYNSVRAGRLKGSGSTITQQTVKNVLLTQEKTLARKVKEVILTRRLEERFSKDEILNIYLNTIYFGHGREGVEEASKFYFGKPALELELHEAATLAGLIQSPERHTPRRHPESALRRRRYVLHQMANKGFITEGERDLALERELTLAPIPEPYLESAQWWASEVRRELEARLGRDLTLTGGLRVEGTLNATYQRAAEQAIQEGLRALDQRQRLDRPHKHLKSDEAREAWLKKRARALSGKRASVGARLKGLVTKVSPAKRGGLDVRLSLGVGEVRLSPYSLERLKEPPKVGDIFKLVILESPRLPHVPQEAGAEGEFSEGVAGEAQLERPQAALVALNPHTREVLALVGGWRYRESPFNRVTQARRQPGSAFKPFVYGAALESRRYTLTSELLDAPETWLLGGSQRWTPQNYNRRFIGPVSFTRALAKSINSVAVRLADAVGLARVIDLARRAGVKSELVNNLTLALGSSELTPLELVNAYATLITGRHAEPVIISSVMSPSKEELWPRPQRSVPAVSEDVSWLMTRLMRAVVTEGSGRKLRAVNAEVIGKTGTSNKGKDAWFVGATPSLVFGVWVGYDHPQPLGNREAGGGTAAPIALTFLKGLEGALDNKGFGEWPAMPEGVVERRVDPKTGLLAREDTKGAQVSYYLRGTEPTELTPLAESPNLGLFGLGEEDE